MFLYPKLGQIAFLYLEISSKDFLESFHDGEAPKYCLGQWTIFTLIWAQNGIYLEIYSKDFLSFGMIVRHLN